MNALVAAATSLRHVVPDYDAAVPNPSLEASEDALAREFENGCDLSQLGIKRSAAKTHFLMDVHEQVVCYLHPHLWGLKDAVALRVTVDMEIPTNLTDAQLATVQEAVVPSAGLSEDDIAGVIDTVKDELVTQGPFIRSQVAAAVSLLASGHKEVVEMIQRVVPRGNAGATVGAAMVEDFEAAAVDMMDMGDVLLVLKAARADKMEDSVIDSIRKHLALIVYKTLNTAAAAYYPFSEAIDKARTDQVAGLIPADLDNRFLRVSDARSNKSRVRVEVVTADSVADEFRDVLCRDELEGTEKRAKASAGPEAKRRKPEATAAESKDEEAADETAEGLELSSVEEEPEAAPEVKLVPVPGLDWVSLVASKSLNEDVSGELAAVGRWVTVTSLNRHIKAGMVRAALGAYQLRKLDVEETDASQLAFFAATRSELVDRSLYQTGGEVLVKRTPVSAFMSLEVETSYVKVLKSGVLGQVALVAAHISFMKAGHHASAAALAHLIDMILKSLSQAENLVLPAPDYAAFLGLAVYGGAHPGDQRLYCWFFRRMYARNELSFSIGRRLMPNGPGTVAPYLLMLIMKQLEGSSFFTVMNREEDAKLFFAAYGEYAKTSHLETPYANFMYGQSRPESVGFRNFASRFMAYADAISEVMPETSFQYSMSLTRDARAAAANTILASLEVRAFVRAYRAYIEQGVNRRLQLANAKTK